MNTKKFFVWLAVKRHLADSSIRHAKIRYRYLLRWLSGKSLTVETAESFILYLRERKLRNSSINGYIRILNLIDIFHRENGTNLYLLKNIAYFPKEERAPTIISIEEIDALLNTRIEYKSVRGSSEERINHINSTFKLSIWILASTGCRFDEMASLKKENLSLGIDESWIEFKNTKTKEDRRVPIPSSLSEALKEHVKTLKPTELVLTSSRGNKLVEQTYNPWLRKHAELAGLSGKHIHAHAFRHSYIMEHRRQGTDPLTVAKLVGHRDVNSTLRYGRWDYSEILKGAENHPLFARSLTAEKLLKKTIAVIESLGILKDSRFNNLIQKSGSSLLFKVAER